jgi:hypothetical protein
LEFPENLYKITMEFWNSIGIFLGLLHDEKFKLTPPLDFSTLLIVLVYKNELDES